MKKQSIQMHWKAPLLITLLIILFSGQAFSHDRCPSSEDHSLSALRYKLYTAFHMGYDGYEVPCNVKCMGRESCQTTCQNEKGLELLSKKMRQVYSESEVETCQSFASVCMEQCESLGKQCQSVCQENNI